jgi:hypothetical protein
MDHHWRSKSKHGGGQIAPQPPGRPGVEAWEAISFPDKPDENLAVIINPDPIIKIQGRQMSTWGFFNERENPL